MKKYFPTILVVDDDANDRLLIERALRRAGMIAPIHLVCDGAEAIACFIGEGKFADRAKYAYPKRL